ncbi:CPW-WPC family protein [Gregarina niphandrodes]|uniref:CPW-WPC family protein n=1 Tax=Gregarina niphandrodes TaxID=110365 RepID=A0A023BBB3_GRENI|nr:CPW-WPC family protein [Gregarina niphandrodes]EZG79460.1 CPW-WPC family protein [Gregarina niphandrodes]|eukprot:XP_011134437.1 CPW-WPC family protein [Gregarina niphandrodes]
MRLWICGLKIAAALKHEFLSETALAESAKESKAGQEAIEQVSSTLTSFSDRVSSQGTSLDPDVVFESYCVHDYSAPCPDGWAVGDKSEYCIAGLSYTGSKEPYFPLPVDTKAKQNVENDYGIHWPCAVSGCVQDYTVPCPEGWSVSSDGICSEQSGPQTFAGFAATESDRRSFSLTNGVTWPCMTDCIKDYHTFLCPIGWEEVLFDNVVQCEAPTWYQGPCPGIQAVGGLTVDLLRELETRCKVSYPCQACKLSDKLFDQFQCPVGWQVDDSDHLCHRTRHQEQASLKRHDTCAEVLGVTATSSKEEKLHFEIWCGARWPCASDAAVLPDCAQDFTYPCPLGWVSTGWAGVGTASTGMGTTSTGMGTTSVGVTENGVSRSICKAPDSYVGRCPATMTMVDTVSFKQAASQHCGFVFPCLSDSAPELWTEAAKQVVEEAPSDKPYAESAANGPINMKGQVVTLPSWRTQSDQY